MRLTVGGSCDESPSDARKTLAVLIVRAVGHTTNEVVLLVGHDPRTRSVTMVPERLVAIVCGLHGTVTVIAAVGLGVTVVEAAAGVEVMTVDDPVLAFCLIIYCSTPRIVLTHTHSRNDEDTIDLVTVEGDRGHVSDRKGVESAKCRTNEGSARCLIKVIGLFGLIVKDCDPTGSVGTELVLCSSICITTWITCAWLHDTDVEGLEVRSTHDLIERSVISRIKRTGGAVCSHTRSAATGIDVTWSFRTGRRRTITLCGCYGSKDRHRYQYRKRQESDKQFGFFHK